MEKNELVLPQNMFEKTLPEAVLLTCNVIMPLLIDIQPIVLSETLGLTRVGLASLHSAL